MCTGGNGVGRPKPKTDDARRTAAHVFLHQGVILVVWQAGVIDPAHFGMIRQVTRHLDGVFADAVHAQREGLDTLQDLKRIHGRERRSHVAEGNNACAPNVGCRAQRFGIDHAVVAHVGLIQSFEAGFVFGPGKLAAVDNRTADAGAVAAQVLGERMHHDVGAMLERTAQVRAGDRVVHDQRHPGCMGHGREGADIGHVAQRIAHGFAVDRLGALVDQRGKSGRVARIGKTHRDAHLWKGMGKQVIGSAVQRGC
ncbi:MAG: hypothetical protein BWX79_01112 [Alphaproteobacteria bacterium ADurb.Bin100]|nr:MAG: hypothetical protein BWX79_01112 [Alphaproteobacteria bacterium ADurb.Bin100]